MKTTLLVLCLGFTVACGVQQTESRVVKGQLALSSLAQLDNPAIVMRGADGSQRITHLSRTGEFKLTVPVGVSLRLAVGTSSPSGVIREVSTIHWPHAWTRVSAGTVVELGVVHLLGASARAAAREADGGLDDDHGDHGDDGEDENEHEGEGDDHCGGSSQSARAELPCDAKIPLGASYQLMDSFLEKGVAPAAIVSVTLEHGSWRLAELQANTVFTVTQSDCDHAGSHDTGRDRAVITWRNADGSVQSDDLELRYCDGDSAPSANRAPTSNAPQSGSVDGGYCGDRSTTVCEDQSAGGDSECDGDDDDSGLEEGTPGAAAMSCDEVPAMTPPTMTPPTTNPPASGGAAGAACTVNADCAASLSCFQNVCVPSIN